jgi:aspartate aminotransferase
MTAVSAPRISSRLAGIKPSPTLALGARIQRLKAEGRDIIALNGGEPDFNTPEPIIEAAKLAMDAGLTKYTPTPGAPALRAAVAEKFRRENGLSPRPEETIITVGAKQAVQNALLALIEPGDEVLLLAPFWPTYADQVRMAGGIPAIVSTEMSEGFQPDLDRLKAACTPRTKAIIINSPCNPTGAVLERPALKEIASMALTRGLWVISDEIYERLVYDGFVPQSIAALGTEIAARTVTISGASKAFAMTGWRIGYACGPLEAIQAMNLIQDQQTSGAVTFAQEGARAALALPDEEVEAMRREYDARRELMGRRLLAISGVRLQMPKGAFYHFPDFSAFLGGRAQDDFALAELLLEAGVAAIPGSCFEGPGHLRLSYACSREAITLGLDRLEAALAGLRA